MPCRELSTEVFYHIYNRGHNKQQIFFDEQDYNRFYANIERYSLEYPQIEIFAYCFLPNHFHFLMREVGSIPGTKDPEISLKISKFMNRLQLAYAAYFNTRYRETVKQGLKCPIFEGRFNSKLVDSEDYLAQLQVYIEHNAVKHEIVERTEDWPWTSYSSIPGSKESGLNDDFNPVFA